MAVPIGKPDNAANAPLRFNPKGRGDSGPITALLAPDVEPPHGVARALFWGQIHPGATAE